MIKMDDRCKSDTIVHRAIGVCVRAMGCAGLMQAR